MAGVTEKNPLLEAIGIVLRERRRERGKGASRDMAQRIGVSPSYFRAIEAGSVPPPPSISIALAIELDWPPARLAELLCLVPYVQSQAATYGEAVRLAVPRLLDHDVVPELARLLTQGGDLVAAIRQHLSTEHRPPPSGEWANVPWVFHNAFAQMVKEVSGVYSSVDKDYLVRWVDDYRSRIRRVHAHLSYTLKPQDLVDSGYNFAFMANRLDAKISINSPGATAELGDALVEAIAQLTGVALTRLKPRVRVEEAAPVEAFLFDQKTRRLTDADDKTDRVRRFRNAWLYKIAGNFSEDWVGFIDDFSPDLPNFDAIALSVADANILARRLCISNN